MAANRGVAFASSAGLEHFHFENALGSSGARLRRDVGAAVIRAAALSEHEKSPRMGAFFMLGVFLYGRFRAQISGQN